MATPDIAEKKVKLERKSISCILEQDAPGLTSPCVTAQIKSVDMVSYERDAPDILGLH